jgi:hypothetical protein
MTGTVTHTWEDPYDFTDGGFLSRLANKAAEAGGGAAVYTNTASWDQEMTAVFEIVDGDLRLKSIEWIDVDLEPDR